MIGKFLPAKFRTLIPSLLCDNSATTRQGVNKANMHTTSNTLLCSKTLYYHCLAAQHKHLLYSISSPPLSFQLKFLTNSVWLLCWNSRPVISAAQNVHRSVVLLYICFHAWSSCAACCIEISKFYEYV